MESELTHEGDLTSGHISSAVTYISKYRWGHKVHTGAPERYDIFKPVKWDTPPSMYFTYTRWNEYYYPQRR
eukprot:6204522-Pleurochrysis_carterae.AAC.2